MKWRIIIFIVKYFIIFCKDTLFIPDQRSYIRIRWYACCVYFLVEVGPGGLIQSWGFISYQRNILLRTKFEILFAWWPSPCGFLFMLRIEFFFFFFFFYVVCWGWEIFVFYVFEWVRFSQWKEQRTVNEPSKVVLQNLLLNLISINFHLLNYFFIYREPQMS